MTNTINLTPTWAATMRILIAAITGGNQLLTHPAKAAEEELMSLARSLDAMKGDNDEPEGSGQPSNAHEIIAAAVHAYGSVGEIEFDSNAKISESDEGYYVQAWVWVSRDDV